METTERHTVNNRSAAQQARNYRLKLRAAEAENSQLQAQVTNLEQDLAATRKLLALNEDHTQNELLNLLKTLVN